MAFKIGFAAEHSEKKPAEATYTVPQQAAAPRKSVVQVYFAGRNMTLSYYNDQFDLHRGDIVYVDGKLEGMRGRVMESTITLRLRCPITSVSSLWWTPRSMASSSWQAATS